MGRIITLVLIVLLIVGGVWWWRNYHDANLFDGSVSRRDAAMATGTTTLENGQNIGEAHPTPSRSDAPGTINGDPYQATPEELGTQTTPITQDPYGKGGAYGPSGPYGAGAPETAMTPNPAPGSLIPPPNSRGRQGNVQESPQISYAPASPAYSYSSTDTQTPNAPNGVRFGGNDAYQWYRQGNITYRVDTRTGNSCVAYATLEEWRRPYVSHHGCRTR